VEAYRPDGYPPVYIGEIIHSRYVIVARDDWDDMGTYWLAKDFAFNAYVRIKILKMGKKYMKYLLQEIEYQQRIDRHINDNQWSEVIKLVESSKDDKETKKVA